MQQRQPRLGDVLDDYCPRERRLTNHVVVAMIGDVPGVFCPLRADLHEAGRLRLSDPVNASPCQLPFVREIEQPVLKGRGPQIGDEDFHEQIRVKS